ncbi:PRD domain-containing protein [Paenibacillus tyrfis]|uniref:PRD domain-containing protein n=1 Tax=Paenibacillus tyrfis TaxID=1501230 RepID=UPI000B594C7A|nr:PRD domain-containing protein [Paenibacillus tyrfis]
MSMLAERLELLFGTDTITAHAKHVCEAAIQQFIVPGEDKKYTKLITHLAMALTRIERKEVLNAPPGELMEEVVQSEHYGQARQHVAWIVSICNAELPDEERQYLEMHFVHALTD